MSGSERMSRMLRSRCRQKEASEKGQFALRFIVYRANRADADGRGNWVTGCRTPITGNPAGLVSAKNGDITHNI